MNHGCGIDLCDSTQNAIPQLFPRFHTDMFQEGARHFSEQGLHNVKPGSVSRRQHVSKSVWTGSQIGVRLLGNVRRVVVQDHSDGALRRIVIIQVLEQSDEFDTAVAVFYARGNMAVVQVQRRPYGASPQSLLFVVAGHLRMYTGHWR